MKDNIENEARKRDLLRLARNISLAETGKLGSEIETGYPEGEIPGESPRVKQIRLARSRQELLEYKPEGESSPVA
ncbi:MAG: hypothetical protein UU16_C0022G0030 [Candidatus Woesebacteria bacterium GW2011_GWA2_40_7]|uniref:Uncharacterized protein n=3 Tax=Candidatus Woeseibacteriota TaxID=1752722 RepID=A0A0G0UUK7_9BACT|nr:MAG: hypothetical protein UT17_C0002G0200 [Candidatus Woesebacteria bacterium GW2011_GWB1_39_10]KKR73408.1 MAG: hypothetical protein UU16_C0022G0030 [Candidatus Woesebacteria bacterium GW2011_GWA2_40_7]KKR92449.1 MAG: hypothetical protein UU42_C0001G0053 [Candidatus Woesebacteria bacterium GW2011_GWA1_41_13b]